MLKEAKVSKSTYYYWAKHKDDSWLKDKDSYLLIKKIFIKHSEKIGIRQIYMKAKDNYHTIINLKKIARIKKQYNLITKVRVKKPHIFAKKKDLEHRIAPNILDMNFKQDLPDKVYSTDISYLPYATGRAYLSATKDLASNEIVAFNVNRDLSLETGFESLIKKVSKMSKKQRETLMIHSDQGLHYTNNFYVNKLKELGVTQSMSRKGNCLDNAPIESFFGHLKDEIELKACKSFEEVVKVVSKYIHYYNNDRPQWTLKKMTPAKYRCHLLKDHLL